MHRIPKPSEQARHLRGMLAEFGVTLTHQQTLEMVARLHGHKSWNVMQASPAVVRDSKDDPKLKALEAAARAVLDSESNRGRYEDLTVVSRPAIAALRLVLDGPAVTSTVNKPVKKKTFMGFSADDVLSVRPDLTMEEAKGVLDFCERNYDASVGLSWDLLTGLSLQAIPQGFVPCSVFDGELQLAVASLYDGNIYLCHFGELKAGIVDAWKVELSAVRNHQPMPKGSFVSFNQNLSVSLEGCLSMFDGDTSELADLRAMLQAEDIKVMRLR